MSQDDFAEYIPHDEFRSGLAHGRFRLVVNPELAQPYVRQRLRLNGIVIVIIGIGIAIALAGHGWLGAFVVFGAIAVNRLVKNQAAKIVVQLALQHADVYDDITARGIMEVRRAA